MKKLFMALLFLFVGVSAQAEIGEVFGQYADVKPPLGTQARDKIEIVEMFWYGCRHCYNFEPHVEKMVRGLPEDVIFRKVPAIFRKGWEPHARAYYVALALGVEQRITPALFRALHRERRKINSEEALADFFAEQGVAKEDFLKTYRSFAISNKVRQAKIVTAQSGIDGVPAVIVNGKYRTSGGLSGGLTDMLKVIDVLVDSERKP